MALIMRLKSLESIKIRLEDGRVITICVEAYSKNRTITYIDAPGSVRIERIQKKVKEDDERSGSPRE